MDIKNLLSALDKATSFEEQLALIENDIKNETWYSFLKWEEFNMWSLFMCYEMLEDDDSTIWKDETPAEEREQGEKILLTIRAQIVAIRE